MATVSKSKLPLIERVFQLLKEYWYVVLGLLIFAVPLYRLIKKQVATVSQDVKESQNSNPLTQSTKADKITTNKALQSAAKRIASDLGYKESSHWYDWLNPRTWTENDKSVADALVMYASSYSLISRLYYECYTPSRNLTTDLLNLLDSSELDRVRNLINI